ncbi:dna repair protein rad5 [Moniliophthora roreri MCA 2997]|uniref:Dna repair protein rad5 n=1 Tax=Moniliophthora roreri (strain MCA 2997) TaxID=1381753 RepID=V2YJP4_MONRO|nr:dna repair protein rad5 [Moniliophthora roreri MCA 2997]
MEAFRQRLMQHDSQLYPELQRPSKSSISSSSASSSASSASAISISSDSSSGTVNTATESPELRQSKPRPNTIIISSDEEEDENDEQPLRGAMPLKPSNVDRSNLPPPSAHKSKSMPQTSAYSPKSTMHYETPPVQPSQYNPGTSKYSPFVVSDDGPRGEGEAVNVPEFAQDAYTYTSPAEAEKALRDLMGGAMNEDSVEVHFDENDAIVNGFKDDIRLLPHQIVGRKWMKEREDPKMKRFGGILADDMGLGKTIQTLTRIVEGRPKKSDKEDGWSPTTLVVCPLALVGQWADEIKKMANGLNVIKHQGPSRTSNPHELRNAHVVVTTYDTLKSEHASFNPPVKEAKAPPKSKAKKPAEDDPDDSSSEGEHFGRALKKNTKAKGNSGKGKTKDALFRVRWFRVVLDEAHNIKNRNTNGAKACYELEAKFRWTLTGTPMQNDVTELFSLLKFLHIKPFNDWERFNEQIAKPVKSGRGANRAMKRLQVVLKQIMLRRRKDDTMNGKKLIELPKRKINIVSCPFSASEQHFYSELEGKMEKVLDKLNQDAQAVGKSANYMSVLLLLLRLRQACNHPILVSNDYKTDLDAVESRAAKANSDADADADDLVAAFGQLGVTRKCQVCTSELTSSNFSGKLEGQCDECATLTIEAKSQISAGGDSAKIRKILELLEDVDERSRKADKTIIFSQFTSMLDLIQPFLRDRGWRFVRYDGTMKPPEREATLRTIKSDPDVRVILISFKAGSTGLNLTVCNNVILVDLWWNPALEDQAFDRSHRFGQTKDVNIYKLKVDETVEDRILELQEKKRELARAALSGDKIKNMRLGMEDLLALFRPGRDDGDDEDD